MNQKPKKKPNIHASYLGKRSAEIRKLIGHDREYYRQLANKRWSKAKKT